MIIKRNFNPIRVVQYVKWEVLFSVVVSVATALMSALDIVTVTLPFSIAAILGSALAIFIAFRNNSAYGRWWEARTLWGGIINSSRVFGRLVITFTDSHKASPQYDKVKSEKFKQELLLNQMAWVHALRIQLREQNHWHELKSFLSEQEWEQINQAQNKPNMLQLLMGRKIYNAMQSGVLQGFDSFQLEGQLLALANYQGGCERIKNTPLLRQYDFFTRLFLYTFIFLLPFSLLPDFNNMNQTYWMIPVSIVIAFVFSILGKVGEVNENPFENRITDVPMSAMSIAVERDLKEMLGNFELPNKLEAERGFLY